MWDAAGCEDVGNLYPKPIGARESRSSLHLFPERYVNMPGYPWLPWPLKTLVETWLGGNSWPALSYRAQTPFPSLGQLIESHLRCDCHSCICPGSFSIGMWTKNYSHLGGQVGKLKYQRQELGHFWSGRVLVSTTKTHQGSRFRSDKNQKPQKKNAFQFTKSISLMDVMWWLKQPASMVKVHVTWWTLAVNPFQLWFMKSVHQHLRIVSYSWWCRNPIPNHLGRMKSTGYSRRISEPSSQYGAPRSTDPFHLHAAEDDLSAPAANGFRPVSPIVVQPGRCLLEVLVC